MGGDGGSSGRAHRREGVGTTGWGDNDLANRAKGDPAKVATARRLRKETTMTFQVTAFPCRASSGTFGPARSTSAWNTSKERGAIR